MSYALHCKAETAPIIGIAINAIGSFSTGGKELTENKFLKLFEDLKKEGAISKDSILKPRIFGPHEALAVADEFAASCVDGILLINSAFPNGHVFPTIAMHPGLSRTPMIVSAEYEPDLGDNEWTTNAWCGVTMNNHVAKRLGRYIRPLAGMMDSAEYKDELKMLANCIHAISFLRRDFLGRFGDAPGGFHSATMDQMAFLRTFGTKVEMVDLIGLMTTYNTGRASGYVGESTFTDADVEATLQEMKSGRPCLVTDDELRKGAKFYHAMKAQIEANGFTSIAVKCWPELCAPDINIAACFPMTWLLTKGIVTAAGCESDCPITVMQTLGTLLSGKPSSCLDFVNYPGRCGCMELGHCGVGIAGQMGDGEAIAYKSPDRQGKELRAPALIGQFEYGRKTGITVTQDNLGKIKVLCFTGENTPQSAMGKLYSGSDLVMGKYAELSDLIMEHGFPHHLAVAANDISREVSDVCAFLGVECHTIES